MTGRRNGFGRQADSFVRAVTLRLDDEGEVTSFQAVFIRAPRAGGPVPASACLARITVGSSPSGLGVLLATAFHPELTPGRRIHEFFVSMVKGTS
jgi:5'-phosphate synthase pdxT subunit